MEPVWVSPQMQYTFIYQALLEYYLYGDTELDVSSLEKHLQALHGPTAHFDKIGLEEEFRVSADLLSRRTGLVHTKLVAAASSPRNARKSKGIYPARDFQWKNHGNFQSSAAMSVGGGGRWVEYHTCTFYLARLGPCLEMETGVSSEQVSLMAVGLEG